MINIQQQVVELYLRMPDTIILWFINTQYFYFVCRYAEGTGTVALFSAIRDIDFLSSTELICTDYGNHCLRLVDLSPLSLPETSTFAGNCTVEGNADGHRLDTALFQYPVQTEVENKNSAIFVLENYKTLHMIDIITDNVANLVTFAPSCYYMKLFGVTQLYFSQRHQITRFNIYTIKEVVAAGKLTQGLATGTFRQTQFYHPFGLFPWTREMDLLLLVADQQNNRFAVFFTI